MNAVSYNSLSSECPTPEANDHDRAFRPHSSEDLGEPTSPSKLPTAPMESVGQARTFGAGLKYLFTSWKWEAASCLLILTIPFVIFATLYPHDGHPLPQWPFRISVNTLLSIYSIILRSGLSFILMSCIGQFQWNWFTQARRPLYDLIRFDNAGRGAWGSLQLLWAQRLHQPLTVLGGLLIIVSIGIDPSIQQLISPSDCSVAVLNERATLPRTNLFYDYLATNGVSGSEFQLALLRGVSQPESSLYSECATGNCSFPDLYGTIGYCSACEDISKEIAIDSFYVTMSNKSSELDIRCGDNSSVFRVLRTSIPISDYSETSPGSSHLNVTNFLATSTASPCYDINNMEVAKIDTAYNESRREHWKVVLNILAGKTLFSDNYTEMSSGNLIASCENKTLVDSWRCRGYGAATCTIQPCVRVYNATVEAGHLAERLISQSETMAWSTSYWENATNGDASTWLEMVDTHCLTPKDIDELADQGCGINKTYRWLPYDISGSEASSSLTDSLLARKCVYLMDYRFGVYVGPSTISQNFNGILKATTTATVDFTEISISSFDGPQTLQHIYDAGNIDFDRIQQTFSNISDSLTTWIRTHGHENYSDPAVGQVFHYATCIQVRWQWMLFSSSIVLLTMLLFIVTVCSTALKQFPAWKASFLPWLICGPGSAEILGVADQLEETSCSADEIENKAKEITVIWKALPEPHVQL
ncbi:hypothetical protein F5Y00DRAFT_272406 [Daldinia vernicosa]|uniref:uncharacterized protein n=1 Tax=Daldinia vernicosa TaxID=114800 RepID=UPI0020072DFA|nr:uncharacterized protein F5Y00DRAFT_272406 [Daldinia vernicosa]KAI0852748.1 hypothetical protein F5Y00DRAFT_272406 [Daldinia vernicosa]